MKNITRLFSIFVLAITPIAASAAEYFVDPAGNDQAAGDRLAPWRSVNRVNNASLAAGDVVSFKAGGTWTEILNPRTSGTAAAPIIFGAYDVDSSGRPIAFNATTGKKPKLTGVTFYGKSYIRLRHMELTPSSTSAVAISNSSYIVVSDSSLYSYYTYWAPVISIQGSHHNQILNNTVGSVEANNDVINLRGNADNNLFEGNTITVNGVHCGLSIEGMTGGGTANYNIVRGNTFIGTRKAGSLFALQSNSNYAVVENNVFTSDGTAGSYCFQNQYARHQGMFKLVTQNNIVRNNVIKDYPCKDTNGITLEAYSYGSWTNIASGNHVYSNVVTNIGVGAMPLYLSENGTGGRTFDNVFKNNVIFNNGGTHYQTKQDGAFPTYTLWAQLGISGNSGSVYNNRFSNNLFYSPMDTKVLWIGGSLLPVNPAPSALFTDNLSVPPQLGSNYRPVAGSPLLNEGAFLTAARTSGSGTALVVEDAGYFSDGHGLIAGDTIRVGDVLAVIGRVDRATNTLHLKSAISWAAGAPVSMPFSGSAPDIGMYDVTAIPDPGTDPENFTITASAGAGGSISPSGALTLASGASQSYTITPASGYRIASVLVDGASVGAVASYTFSNLSASHTIAASFTAVAQTGFSITASVSGSGTISPAGTTNVASGASQTYTITPAANYYLASVMVDGQMVASNTGAYSYTFSNVTANHTISANFLHVDVTLTASAGANGTISPSGSMQVTYGTSRTFTITPASGYRIASVLVDGASVGAVASYTFSNLTANHTISASFVSLVPSYTITASVSGSGTVSPAGTISVTSGGSRTYTITPATGYYTASVIVDGQVVASNTGAYSYTFSNVTSNRTIAVNFLHSDVTITASAGANGSISPAGAVKVTYGTSRAFTITPAAGYRVASVLVDGVSVGPVTSYTFSNLTANHTIAASFASLGYTITASVTGSGTISPAGATSVASGGSRTYTITPAAGYYTASVTVDGRVVASNTGAYSYTFSNVTANHTISVTFLHVDVTITASAGYGGSISPSGATAVTYGTSRTFTITPAYGYRISAVRVDGVSVGAVGSYTFSSAATTRNHTISASFVRR